MGTKLFVGNINHDATENDLQDHFAAAGKVVSVNIIQDRMTQKPRGFGFVEMGDDTSGRNAINELNGRDFLGKSLVVNEARPREERPARSGGFRRNDFN